MLISDILWKAALCSGARPSLVHEGRAFTWAQTADRVARLSRVLDEVATAERRSVVVLGFSGIEYFELTFAVPSAGLVFVPMNIRLSDEELKALLCQVDVAVIVYAAEFGAQVAAANMDPDVALIRWGGHGSGDSVTDYESAIALAAPLAPRRADPEDPWGVIFTGGTTGLPKGVILSHRAIGFNIMTILQDLSWGEHCRFLQVAPLFHLAGLGPSFVVTALGGTHFFLPRFSPESLLEAMAENAIQCTNLVPTMIGWLISHPDLHRYDLSHLQGIAYGASSIALPTLERLLARFPKLTFAQFYGQTESCGGLTCLTSHHHSLLPEVVHRLRAAGRPVTGVRISILDDDDRPVGTGEWGEICATTPGLFSGYLGHEALTATTIRDGWLRTGDVGYLDVDGFLYVTDRKKDMIVTGGENVSSNEVEAAIARFEGVIQVAVVALPDEVWGERVHAIVVTKPDFVIDPEALRVHCRSHIAGYKVPKTITIRHAPLPVSAVGKVRKDVLRADEIASVTNN